MKKTLTSPMTLSRRPAFHRLETAALQELPFLAERNQAEMSALPPALGAHPSVVCLPGEPAPSVVGPSVIRGGAHRLEHLPGDGHRLAVAQL